MTEIEQPTHFTLECYCPQYTSDSGTKMMSRVNHQFSGELNISDVLEQLEIFLRSVGYSFDGNLVIKND